MYFCFLYLDFDECTDRAHNCHAMATCTDTDGSFTCQCPNGYTGNGQTCTGKNETFTEHMCSAKQNVHGNKESGVILFVAVRFKPNFQELLVKYQRATYSNELDDATN